MAEFTAVKIERALRTRRLGRPALFFPRVASTNDVVRQMADAGAPEGLLVLADEQTSGRGRLGRTWWAPPGTSLLLSLLLRPPVLLHRAPQLTMCLGLGSVQGIERVTGLRPALKWPNDLQLAGRKLGGMLSETQSVGERLEYAILGLGVNVNLALDASHAEAAPTEIAANAISLSMALGRRVDRLPLLAAILEQCESWYERFLAGESLHEPWAARLATIGKSVRVQTQAGGVIEGLATAVTPEGALLVRSPTGDTHTIWAGDVTLLRTI